MKRVLVTGSAGGMGKSICRKLLSEGYKVYALDIRETDIEGVISIPCDITNLSEIEKARDLIIQQDPHLDCIVHAAGIYDLDALSEISDERFKKIFEINVFGAYRINKAFTPYMTKGGRITIITSELAPLNPLPFTGIYAITKAALDKYAYSLRSELSLRGIFVSIVRPGAVKTGLLSVSTTALERFCQNTKYFAPNAAHFKEIVDMVEAKSVGPEKIANIVSHSLSKKHPRFVYTINKNFLLSLMSILPDHFQVWILKQILK